MLSRDMEGYEKQPEILDLKNTIAMVKNTLDEFNSRKTQQKKGIVKLNTQQQQLSKMKHVEEKRLKAIRI